MSQETINTAIKNLREELEFRFQWKDSGPLDGELSLGFGSRSLRFVVEVKKEIRNFHLRKVLEMGESFEDFMLIGERIQEEVKKELRNKRIAYLESNGNIHIRKPDLFILIETKKPFQIKKVKGNRAFTKTGLKVLLQFIIDKDLINRTQREIAEKADVGLGNIPQVIKGLVETGYLLKKKGKTYVWDKREDLLKRWITDFETTLLPTIRKANYTIKGNWQEIDFNSEKTVWGGEPAADILTNHLRPEKLILYTKESQSDLIRNYRMIPDENGEAEVYEMFWINDKDSKIAPSILVYADLMIAGGKRNRETAQMIYDEHIKPNL